MKMTVSAAERSIDVSQDPSKRDDVLRVNVQLPEFLSKISSEKGILLIQISTGCVAAMSFTDLKTMFLMGRILRIIRIARQSMLYVMHVR